MSIFMLLLYPNARGPKWLPPALSAVSFSMFYLCDWLAKDISLKSLWIIVCTCLVLVETVNQATYHISKQNEAAAANIKCCLFWAIVFSGGAVHMIVSGLETSPVQLPSLSAAAGYAMLACLLPNYSFSPEYRFLLLRGRFQRKRQQDPR